VRWYRVTKKIHGRFYDYWQRTCRVGKTVKTENKYIGPSSKSLRAFEPPTLTRQRNPATAEQQALPITPTEGPSQYEQTVIEYRSLLSSMSMPMPLTQAGAT
jgi:hypothetical protein